MYFDSKEIFKRVENLLNNRGWSLYYLANLANISVNTLYSWRDRQSSPTLYVIENIANAFDVSPISLLLKDEEVKAIDKEHKELFECWNTLTQEQKNSLMSVIGSFKRDTN